MPVPPTIRKSVGFGRLACAIDMANVSKGATVAEPTISDFYLEERTFPPSPEFQARALVSDRSLYEEAERDYVAFWARQARELVSWFSDFDTTLEW